MKRTQRPLVRRPEIAAASPIEESNILFPNCRAAVQRRPEETDRRKMTDWRRARSHELNDFLDVVSETKCFSSLHFKSFREMFDRRIKCWGWEISHVKDFLYKSDIRRENFQIRLAQFALWLEWFMCAVLVSKHKYHDNVPGCVKLRIMTWSTF